MSLWIWKVEWIVLEELGTVPVCIFPKVNEIWANYLGDKPRKPVWEMRIREGTEESKERGICGCADLTGKSTQTFYGVKNSRHLFKFLPRTSHPGNNSTSLGLRQLCFLNQGARSGREKLGAVACGLQKLSEVATKGWWGTHSLLHALCGPFPSLPGKGDSQRLTYVFKEGSCL